MQRRTLRSALVASVVASTALATVSPASAQSGDAGGSAMLGHLDVVAEAAVDDSVRVAGWALDPNAAEEAVPIHVYVGAEHRLTVMTRFPRPDVQAAHAAQFDPNPGFDVTFQLRDGTHEVCAYAIDGTGTNPLLGCERVTIGDVRPELRLGDQGQAVAAWQRQLILVTGADLIVDGIYGSTTEQATVSFQRFFDRRADGVVDEDTRDLMRRILAISRDYTHLATFDDFEAVGYPTESGYCFELRSGHDVAISCGIVTPYRLAAATVAVGGRQVLLGTADPIIDRVVIETAGGQETQATLNRDVRGNTQNVWLTPVPVDEVRVVRGLAGDGSEVRRIVVEDGDAILILERGNRGQAVAAWQGRLNVTGADLATDGVFGERTVQATMDFQRFFGLTVDGIVGPATRETMDIIYSLVIGQ